MRRSPTLFVAAFAAVALSIGIAVWPAHAPDRAKEVSAAPVSAASSGAPVGPVLQAGGLRYIELLTGGATSGERLPVVVALHGSGDRPESFVDVLKGLSGRMRVVVPYGPIAYSGGFVWFDLSVRDDADFARGARIGEPRIARFLKAIADAPTTLGKPALIGFSQGAIATHAVVVMNPELIDLAIPVAGFLPAELAPPTWRPGAPRPVVQAFHGDDDTRITPDKGSATVARLVALGVPAEFHHYPGVSHGFGAEELATILALLDARARDAK